MPNRVIRDSILDSEKVNQLSWAGEIFYRRLMSVVDDYGLFDGRPAILRSKLYPLRIDKVSEPDIVKWISECETAELVRKYQVDGKDFIEMVNFGQTLRTKKAMFPHPPWSEHAKSEQAGYVYAIGTDWTQPIKIGFSLNPWARAREISIGSPVDLIVLATWKGAKPDEALIQKCLADYNVKNEWFQPPEAVLSVLRSGIVATTELLRALRSSTMPESNRNESESEVETKSRTHTREKVPRGGSSDEYYDSGQQMFDEVKADELFVERLLRIVHASGFIACKEVQVLKAARFFITRESAKPEFKYRPRSEHRSYLVNWITKNATTLNQYDK